MRRDVRPVRERRVRVHDRDMTKELVAEDEQQWWFPHDELEPVIGVPSVSAAPVPLIDTAADEPEPGLAPEQEER